MRSRWSRPIQPQTASAYFTRNTFLSSLPAGTPYLEMSLSVVVAMAGSCRLMLPNALAFATGYLSIGAMMRAGLLLG